MSPWVVAHRSQFGKGGEAKKTASDQSHPLSAHHAIDTILFVKPLGCVNCNTCGSIGVRGYALAGNKKLAIANYEKSLELNPSNEAGKKALVILLTK